jgi:hypothetical protein
MRSDTWLRRASWLGCLLLVATALSAVRADEPDAEDEEEIKFVVAPDAPRKYSLGTKLTSVPKSLDAHLDLEGKGALVAEVTAGGPADKAGVKVHDILVSVNGSKVTGMAQVVEKLDASEGKPVTLKLLRAGDEVQLEVQPDVLSQVEDKPGITIDIPSLGVGKIAIDGFEELEDLEHKIREKLKHSGVDFRMQFIRPGHLLPKAVTDLSIAEKLPEDLDIRIHKHGNEPAEIEVRQGDQSWSIKEDELPELPEKIRQYVESFLGRSPGKVTLALPRGQEFRVAVPPPINPFKGHAGFESSPQRPEIPREAREQLERARAEFTERAKEAREKGEEVSRQMRERFEQARAEAARRQEEAQKQVERQLEQMNREMERMRKQMEDLHKRLIDDVGQLEKQKAAEPQESEEDEKLEAAEKAETDA